MFVAERIECVREEKEKVVIVLESDFIGFLFLESVVSAVLFGNHVGPTYRPR